MHTRQSSPPATLRAALIGASALVVLALVLGADLPARAGVGEFQRESLAERQAVRQFATSLARAVRDLVDARTERSPLLAHLGWDLGLYTPERLARPTCGFSRGAWVALLLPELLDLPPPLNG